MAVPVVAMSPAPAARAGWGERALDMARASAIFIAVAATMSTAATSVAVVFFLGALIISGRLHRVVADAWHMPAGKAALAFMALLLMSSSWSAVGPQAALADFWAWRKLAYFYLALPLFTGAKWKHRAVVALVCACAVAVALSYISIALHVQLRRYEDGVMGVVLTNYAVQGITFAVAAAASVYLASEAKGRARWFYGFVAAALVINVLFFGTGRTGYLAIVGVTLCWAVLRGGLRYTVIAAMALAVLLAIAYAFSPTFHGRMLKGWSELNATGPLKGETSIGVRVVFAKNALALVAERPVFGYGLGSFKAVYAEYVDARYTGYDALHAGDPHNQYLYVVFEQGLAGLAVFLGFIVILFRSFPKDGYGTLAACALTAWSLGCLFNSHFRTFPEGHFYALVVAILGAGAAACPRIGPRQPRTG